MQIQQWTASSSREEEEWLGLGSGNWKHLNKTEYDEKDKLGSGSGDEKKESYSWRACKLSWHYDKRMEKCIYKAKIKQKNQTESYC